MLIFSKRYAIDKYIQINKYCYFSISISRIVYYRWFENICKSIYQRSNNQTQTIER